MSTIKKKDPCCYLPGHMPGMLHAAEIKSRKERAQDVIRQVALRKGVCVDEVYQEMERAIEIGLLNPDPAVQKFRHMIARPGAKPTPEDVILFAVESLSD